MLTIRPYQAGDEQAICALFETVFGQAMPLDAWHWRFAANPTYRTSIELAWDDDALLGQYAVSPVLLQLNGQELLTGLSVGTMTHPAARGRGVFSALATSLYPRLAADDLALLWGFTKRSIHATRVRDLEWFDIYEVPTFSKTLDRLPQLPPPDLRVTPLDGFDARFDRLWERVRRQQQIIVRRDRRYLNWRYGAQAPNAYRLLGYCRDEELLGYAVFKRYQDSIDLVDLLCVDDEVGLNLVAAVARQAAADGLQAISMWLNVHSSLHRHLEKWGFANTVPITYFLARILRPDLIDPAVAQFKGWHLMMGDCDVY